LILLFLTAGCEEGVDPVLGTDEVFSIYGYLNPREDLQAIRVYSIDGILEPAPDRPLDASVTSINRRTGESIVWRDSVVTFYTSRIGHIFYARFRPDLDTPYTLTVTKSDGEGSTVDFNVPPEGQAEIKDVFSVLRNVVVRLTWSDAPRIINTRVTYAVKIPFPDGSDTTTVRVVLKSGRAEENADGTWTVTILPSDDIGAIFTILNLQPGRNPILLDEIKVEAFVVSEEWESPIGIFDSELLVQPGTFSNVTNGFGFVSGGYFDSFVFKLDDEAALNAGFSLE
jgi:hypothetical protein